jgi:diguanylate cyclase
LHQQEREQAQAKTALALMSECGVAPTPDNFELFFTYTSGSNPGLATMMDSLISTRNPFTSAVLSDLRERCLSSARTTQALDNASLSITTTLTAVIQKLEAAGHFPARQANLARDTPRKNCADSSTPSS